MTVKEDSAAMVRQAVSVAEFAAAFGVSRRFVEHGIRTGRIESIKIGARRLIPMRFVNTVLAGAAG